MQTLEKYSQLLEEKFDKLELESQPANLFEPIKYMLGLPAKRLRPAMVLMSCDVFGGTVDHALPAATAIEMFHNFTLIHDDIMDKAPMRRGKDTVHEKWNSNIGILAGDALYALSIREIAKSPNEVLPRIFDVFTKAGLEVCKGQQLDMDFEKVHNINVEQYIEMITLKTAVLIGTSLMLGAICANENGDNAGLIYDFGVNLGIAFQLKDDLLDVYGGEKFGKQPGGDILANKKTFCLIKALELANIDQYNDIKDLIDNRHEKYSSFEKINKMIALYDSLGINDIAEQAQESYFKKALIALEKLNIATEKKKFLSAFATRLMNREV